MHPYSSKHMTAQTRPGFPLESQRRRPCAGAVGARASTLPVFRSTLSAPHSFSDAAVISPFFTNNPFRSPSIIHVLIHFPP